jgi:hypothetical protein
MRLAALALASLFLSTHVFAQTDSLLAGAPLPPGKPAGVHQAVAQRTENAILIGMGIAGIAVSAYLVAEAGKSSSNSATSTSP